MDVYVVAMEIGELTWEWVLSWKYFERNTLGEQWVEAADSIAANISEGEGRHGYPDRKRFYYIARGSLNESETWMMKSYNRQLISDQQKEEYIKLLLRCRKMINSIVGNLKKKN